MNTTTPKIYDVLIMGAGFAGLCQARHLMLNIPGIKVALIDPRPEERTDKDMKIGESLVEVSALFVGKELGLYEYMIENHTPKNGLNFHWPKDPAQTESLDDYFSIWNNRQSAISSFHLNRAKFERDLLQMNKQMGATFYNGRVVDVDLTPDDALNSVIVKLDGQQIVLQTKHLIDAAGRKFIIGKKTNNLIFRQPNGGNSADNLYNLNNGSAWVRIRNFDRGLFHSGYDPNGATTSHYYGTSHFFGHGHWLWMIPSDKNPLELSIGVIHHQEVIPSEHLNTQDKFYGFLKANHNLLYQLIASGETVDFHYLPRLAHRSKTLFSPDNWYVVGDAANNLDAFYSYGATMISFAAESVTEIIRAKLAGEADAEKKRTAYNEFNLTFVRNANGLIRSHAKQLGHASIMSWRIYFEYMWWFGLILPVFLGKWHLNMSFVPTLTRSMRAHGDILFTDLYQQLDKLVDRGANLGLLDPYRADQLLGDYHPIRHHDQFLENAKFEPGHCNVFAGIKATYFYVILWLLIFQWKGFGLRGVLAPGTLNHLIRLLFGIVYVAMGEQIYRFRMRGKPANSEVAQRQQEFTHYQYRAQLQPWSLEEA